MSTFRYIFLLLYFLFHIFLLFGSISTISKIKESDFKFINGFIQNENLLINSSNLITFTIIGLLFFGLNAMLIWMDARSEKKQLAAKDHEIMALKAQLFDLTPGTSPPKSTGAVNESTSSEEPEPEL